MKSIHTFALSFGLLFALVACSEEEALQEPNNTAALQLNINGLEDLGPNYQYENWIIVNGQAISAGLFTVDQNGVASQTSFMVSAEDLAAASTFVLTIEPNPDPNPAPSAVHILAGDFTGNQALAQVGHAAALGNDFSSSTGAYILATPTDGNAMSDENSGVWFFNPGAGAPTLDLPTLPEGWIYEGWAVIDGQPVTTGTFSSPSGEDGSAPYSGTTAGPPYPGEDFLQNAPMGLSFPTDLSGRTIVISVEPVPDNSPAPFTLKPLAGMVPNNANDRTLYNLNNNAMVSNPSGTVSR